jgi:hypothetical protein
MSAASERAAASIERLLNEQIELRIEPPLAIAQKDKPRLRWACRASRADIHRLVTDARREKSKRRANFERDDRRGMESANLMKSRSTRS